MKCKKCNGHNIRTRTNYSHGKKGRGTKSHVCKDCGSAEMEIPVSNKFRRRGR